MNEGEVFALLKTINERCDLLQSQHSTTDNAPLRLADADDVVVRIRKQVDEF